MSLVCIDHIYTTRAPASLLPSRSDKFETNLRRRSWTCTNLQHLSKRTDLQNNFFPPCTSYNSPPSTLQLFLFPVDPSPQRPNFEHHPSSLTSPTCLSHTSPKESGTPQQLLLSHALAQDIMNRAAFKLTPDNCIYTLPIPPSTTYWSSWRTKHVFGTCLEAKTEVTTTIRSGCERLLRRHTNSERKRQHTCNPLHRVELLFTAAPKW